MEGGSLCWLTLSLCKIAEKAALLLTRPRNHPDLIWTRGLYNISLHFLHIFLWPTWGISCVLYVLHDILWPTWGISCVLCVECVYLCHLLFVATHTQWTCRVPKPVSTSLGVGSNCKVACDFITGSTQNAVKGLLCGRTTNQLSKCVAFLNADLLFWTVCWWEKEETPKNFTKSHCSHGWTCVLCTCFLYVEEFEHWIGHRNTRLPWISHGS